MLMGQAYLPEDHQNILIVLLSGYNYKDMFLSHNSMGEMVYRDLFGNADGSRKNSLYFKPYRFVHQLVHFDQLSLVFY